jgi:alkylation response protein AidB-like acyl-CoA dehydrogenase
VSEEMGHAAADLAISLGVCSFPFTFAMLSPDPEVRDLTRQFCEDTEAKMIGCWAITEPEHGSDWILFDGEYSRDSRCAPQVTAVVDGDEYVINGQKAAWVSNGTIATHAALFLGFDPSRGMENCGIAIVPLDLPGVTRGKPLDKLGQRALNQGEIFFDDVRLPKGYVVCQEPATYQAMAGAILAGANASMGIMFVGVAQAALDEALEYAKQRVQGGRVIFDHQNVKLKLFDMFASVEAARSLARRVAVYNSVTSPPALHYSIASKVFATETAFRVASQAIQIFGGYGLSKDFHIEKIFRDARAAMIEDGVNETLALAGADGLRE